MDKQDIKTFFDRCAPTWDEELVIKDAVITKILDNAGIGAGQKVLDVACGTGVMFPFYLGRGVASVTGIDLSSEMVRIAQEKFADEPRIQVVCGDVEETPFDSRFDAVVVYNAFPHFPDPARLIKTLASLLKDGGRLAIAHGMSREQINAHHEAKAHDVSNGLMAAAELKALFDPYFDVDVVISDDEMYEVSGSRRGA